MKWPFVRRSNYELLEDELNIVKEGHDRILKHANHLSDENDSLLQEINRLNQELASELNSHRETNKHSDKLVEILRNDISTQQGMYEILELKNEELEAEIEETKDALKIAQEGLKETKDHEQKLFEAHDKLNQQNMGLLYEVEEWKKALDYWMGKAATTKSEISKVRAILKQIAKKL